MHRIALKVVSAFRRDVGGEEWLTELSNKNVAFHPLRRAPAAVWTTPWSCKSRSTRSFLDVCVEREDIKRRADAAGAVRVA